MLEFKDIGWWFWLVTGGLLSAGLLGHPLFFERAIGFSLFQMVYFMISDQDVKSFAAQVRLFYTLLLLLALPAPMQIIYWAPLVGTWIRVLFGYCIMARLISLLRWNRNAPLNFATLKRTFLTPPTRGSVLQQLNSKTRH